MSRFCIFALFLVVIFQSGNCTLNCNDITISPGSDATSLSDLEKIAKQLLKPFEKLEEEINKIKNGIGKNSKSPKKTMAEILKPVASSIHLTFPGTLWCGDGYIAKNMSDLGFFDKTDDCCRTHVHCFDDLVAGETKGNIINNGIFTRSACTCDNAFYNCLKNVNTWISYGIGRTYFNILSPQCYECKCPENDCSVTDGGQKCENTCKLYEWKNAKKY